MLEDMVHSQDQQLSIEEITSPLGAQILEFCESELFPETLQNSEVASGSNCCHEDHSSYPTQISNIAADMNNFNTSIDNNERKPPPAITATSTSTGPSTPTVTATRNSNLSITFDDDQMENDISASIDFTSSPTFSAPNHQYINNNNNPEPFNISCMNNHLSLGDMVNGSSPHTAHQYGSERWSTTVDPPPAVVPILGPPLSTSYEEECLPSYIRLRSSQSAIHDPMMQPYLPPFSAESSGIFAGSGLMQLGIDLSHQELEFQGENGALFFSDTLPRVFNCSSELQGLSSESQHLVHGGTSSATTTNLASEISSLEDPTFKVGKLSVEERKRKIHRYMKKRNERNFSKKIKYACRKTLADSRPRVRGRFAKNDELGEIDRNMGSNHEDEMDEDVSLYSHSIPDHQRKVVVKEEEDMDSSEILAHISGVNSFKCNYPIQSWI